MEEKKDVLTRLNIAPIICIIMYALVSNKFQKKACILKREKNASFKS